MALNYDGTKIVTTN